MRCAEIRIEYNLAVFSQSVGQVGVFKIHKEALVKAAAAVKILGAHYHKATGAKLNFGGLGYVFVASCIFGSYGRKRLDVTGKSA